MLTTVTALALVALADPPARKEPPSKAELAAITDRGRDLAGYDAAAWHASDALQAKTAERGERRPLHRPQDRQGMGRRVRAAR